jgi:hypothetical protein
MANIRVSSARIAEFLLSKNVFSEKTVRNLIAIAQLESGNNLNIPNHDILRDGDDSYGLFQVNFKPNAGGDKRAKNLGIPTERRLITEERDGSGGSKFWGKDKNGKERKVYKDMPTAEGLRDWWGITTDLTEEELLEKNFTALTVGMGYKEGGSYAPWATHPDNSKHAGNANLVKKWNTTFANVNAMDFSNPDSVLNKKPDAPKTDEEWERMVLEDRFVRAENELQEINLENKDIQSSYRGTRQLRGGEQIDKRTGLKKGSVLEEDEIYIANNKRAEFLQKTLEETSMKLREEKNTTVNSDFEPVFVTSTNDTEDEDEDYYPTEFGEPEPGMVEEREWDSVESRLKFLEGRDDLLVDGRDLFDIIQNDWEALGLEKGTEEFEAWIEEQLKQTDYYKDLTRNQKTALEQWQPAGLDSGEEEYSVRRRGLIAGQKRLLENILNSSSIVWDEEKILDAAKFFWENGINSESEIKQWLSDGDATVEDVGFVDTEDTVLRGEINNAQQNVLDSARQYFYNVTPETLELDTQRLFNGSISVDELQAEYADYAADLYPMWGDRLQAGRTVLQIANSFSGIFSNTIGRNPMWDGEDSDWILKLGTGEIGPANFAESLRRSSTYDTSARGINAAYQQAAEIGKLMGAVAV